MISTSSKLPRNTALRHELGSLTFNLGAHYFLVRPESGPNYSKQIFVKISPHPNNNDRKDAHYRSTRSRAHYRWADYSSGINIYMDNKDMKQNNVSNNAAHKDKSRPVEAPKTKTRSVFILAFQTKFLSAPLAGNFKLFLRSAETKQNQNLGDRTHFFAFFVRRREQKKNTALHNPFSSLCGYYF